MYKSIFLDYTSICLNCQVQILQQTSVGVRMKFAQEHLSIIFSSFFVMLSFLLSHTLNALSLLARSPLFSCLRVVLVFCMTTTQITDAILVYTNLQSDAKLNSTPVVDCGRRGGGGRGLMLLWKQNQNIFKQHPSNNLQTIQAKCSKNVKHVY